MSDGGPGFCHDEGLRVGPRIGIGHGVGPPCRAWWNWCSATLGDTDTGSWAGQASLCCWAACTHSAHTSLYLNPDSAFKGFTVHFHSVHFYLALCTECGLSTYSHVHAPGLRDLLCYCGPVGAARSSSQNQGQMHAGVCSVLLCEILTSALDLICLSI